jgi:flagellar hook assembly protein FlgD
LDIYNVKGAKVRSVISGNLNAGTYRRTWNGTDDNGLALSSGLYFLRMTAGEYQHTAKLVLMK